MKRHLVYLSQNVDINPSMGIFTNRILYSEVRYGKITDYYEKCSVSPVIGTVFCHADKSREQTSKQHSAPKLIAKTREEKFAEIEHFIYLCIVKEMTIEKIVKKSDEFSVMLIQWLS